jgi:hypothetical protein
MVLFNDGVIFTGRQPGQQQMFLQHCIHTTSRSASAAEHVPIFLMSSAG